MHVRRLTALLLGAWLAGSLWTTASAVGSFRAVDHVLKSPVPPAEKLIETLPEHSAEMLLRHVVSEVHREGLSVWELVQLALGIGVVASLDVRRRRPVLVFAGLLLIVVAIQWVVLTPRMNEAARAIDFVAQDAISVERTIFWRYQNSYWVFEGMKVLTMVGLIANLLIQRSQRPRSRRRHVDAVHHSDHG
jgi:hypothetical protein